MALLAVFLIALGLLVLVGWVHLKADEKVREDILNNSPHIDDAEYLSTLFFVAGSEQADLALRLRGIFADIGRLPRECISADILLADLFRAQCVFMQDGIDWAELVMELEDGLGIVIPEGASVPVDEDYTVGAFTEKIAEFLEPVREKRS